MTASKTPTIFRSAQQPNSGHEPGPAVAQGPMGDTVIRSQVSCCASKPTESSESNRKSTSSLHLWELPSKYLCSIVGTCATIPEIQKLALKSRIENPGQYTDYHLHNIFVNAAHDGTYPGRLLDKLFQRKFKLSTALYRNSKPAEFEALWEQVLNGGEVAGSYYALLTSPKTPPAVRDKAVGDIHMLSHISGMSCRIDLKHLPQLRKENQELALQLKKLNLKYLKEIQASEKIEAQLEKSRSALKAHLQEQTDAKTELDPREVSELKKLREKNRTLIELVDRLRKEKTELRQTMQQFHSVHCESQQPSSTETCGVPAATTVGAESRLCKQLIANDGVESLPNTNLHGKKVLYVGGRFRQVSHFRNFVEKLNGTLIYHDGGREDGDRRLDQLLPQADFVVCPIDCISHNAVGKIKRECQKHNICFLPVRRSSLTSLARALGHAHS